jgi:hypothetical protein
VEDAEKAKQAKLEDDAALAEALPAELQSPDATKKLGHMPDREALEARVRGINGESLLKQITATLEPALLPQLQKVASTYQTVDRTTVADALAACNAENANVPAGQRYITPYQQHGQGPGACCTVVDGTFPTTTAINVNSDTLTSADNTTVMTMSLLEGVQPGDFADHFVRANRMPTTLVGDYTCCPAASDYSAFSVHHVKLLERVFAAGVQVSQHLHPARC